MKFERKRTEELDNQAIGLLNEGLSTYKIAETIGLSQSLVMCIKREQRKLANFISSSNETLDYQRHGLPFNY